jgi:hypothetical protein
MPLASTEAITTLAEAEQRFHKFSGIFQFPW